MGETPMDSLSPAIEALSASTHELLSQANVLVLASSRDNRPWSASVYFAHRGALVIEEEIRGLLGKYSSRIKRRGGSEVLFWQTIKMLEAYGSPVKALEMALDEIRTVWISCRDRYQGLAAPFRDLDMFLASPNSLTVLSHRSPASVGAAQRSDGRIAWRRDGGRVIFSSEPAGTRPGWSRMKGQQIAHAELHDGEIRLKFTDLKGVTA